ncbi:MAG: hypothetical protein Kow0069_37500 [Promethearchaeota archaeon]
MCAKKPGLDPEKVLEALGKGGEGGDAPATDPGWERWKVLAALAWPGGLVNEHPLDPLDLVHPLAHRGDPKRFPGARQLPAALLAEGDFSKRYREVRGL